jgi:hypothetical protein
MKTVRRVSYNLSPLVLVSAMLAAGLSLDRRAGGEWRGLHPATPRERDAQGGSRGGLGTRPLSNLSLGRLCLHTAAPARRQVEGGS